MTTDTPKELTPEQKQELTEHLDEQTVFSLAVMMLEVHTASYLKQQDRLYQAFMKVNVILRNNPGFPERFKAVQKQIMTAASPPIVATLKSPGNKMP